MKDFTIGTLIACLSLAFLAGFITCHKLYTNNQDGILRIKK